MSENTAEEKYRAFENLRSRFGGDKSSRSRDQDRGRAPQHQSGKGKRRPSSGRPDPRSNAPPLVPLVEEESQVDMIFDGTPLVIGKWKYNNVIKSNHLNGPDFDALETASVASCSSAYSSKSESSIMSPPCGSVTELSDAGSCDTFQEYDVFNQRKHKPQLRLHHLHPGKLKTTSLHSESDEPIKFASPPPDAEVLDNFVQDHVRVWNGVIGEWRFEGVSPVPSPLSSPAYKVTNEVRLPTPVWTPQGSTDNLLLDTESRSSLLSSEDDWGVSARSKSHSTSNLAATFQSMSLDVNHVRSSSEDLFHEVREEEWREGEGIERGDATPSDKDKNPEVEKTAFRKSFFIGEEQENAKENDVSKLDGNVTDSEPGADSSATVSKKPNTGKRRASLGTPFVNTNNSSNRPSKVAERIRLLRSISNSDLQTQPRAMKVASERSNKWQEAYSKSNALKTVQESQGSEVKASSTPPTRSEPTRMKITERALLFGETIRSVCVEGKALPWETTEETN